MVCGAKGVGKSTFVRLAVNTLLRRVPEVALLDADCGQPEVTPPGLVSLSLLRAPLLGPPAARLGLSTAPRPVDARFIGDVSPKSDPQGYAAAVEALLRAWRGGATGDAPLVINTQGWVRGLGLELLSALLSSARPTHLATLRAPDTDRGPPPGLFWCGPDEVQPACVVLPLASAAPQAAAQRGGDEADVEEGVGGGGGNAPQRSPADLRAALWAAWGHTIASASSSEGCGARSDAAWAAAWAPHAGATAALPQVARALTGALARLHGLAYRELLLR